MSNTKSIDIARRAQAIYETRLKAELEATHADEFVAIEPDSGDFYLGNSLSEAIQTARKAHPESLPFVIRVANSATVELGVLFS